jgi:hypothetical protein
MKSIFKWVGRSLAVLLLLVVLVLGMGYWTFDRMIAGEVRELYASSSFTDETLVTEALLEDLPAPVQRYLIHAGVVGKPIVHTVRLKQAGRFRTGFDQPWMEIRASEYYNVDDPGFIWDATFYQNGLPILRVHDSYRDGKGYIIGKIGALVPMLEDQGEGVDQGTMLRYLQEMTWFPSAFLNENISFVPIDNGSAQVTLTDHNKSVTGTLYIDEVGRLTNFVAERYRNQADGYGTWTTPMTDYGEYEGLQLPKAGKGVWLLPEGEFDYIDVTATEIEYNVPRRY